MEGLKRRYKKLRLREIEIKKKVNRANSMPYLEVIHWLDDVDIVKKQVKQLERSIAYKIITCFSGDCSGCSCIARKLSREVDRLWDMSGFSDDAYQTMSLLKEHCPSRSQILGTIWENLMDPDVGITGIYGGWGVGKTTAMMTVNKKLLMTDKFDFIFWVTVSKIAKTNAERVYQLQTELAQQMKIDLPESGRTFTLHEGLKKCQKFLIIIDGLCDAVPLTMVGIPEPNRENCSKVVLIARYINICHIMKSDNIIRVNTFSETEKWNMFASKVGEGVLAPDIIPLAEKLIKLCPGRPLIVNAISHAMKDEFSIQVWRNTIAHLMGFETEGMVFELLKLCYECLKDDMVQKCYLYCALFPNGYFFKPEEVIKYWIDEGFILGDVNIARKTKIGFRILRKLLDAEMLEMSPEDDCIKMGDMWRKWSCKAMIKDPGLYINSLGNSRHVKQVYKEVDLLQEISISAEDMFTFKSVIQRPKRAKLLDTVWENLMNPNVRITSIYGEWGVGKTTAMMKIIKLLADIPDKFDSIINVTFSKVSGLYQLQTDIALQMNLDLPEIGRAAKLLRGLEKIEKFLIIIDDVSEVIPLIKVGIPVPSGDNRYKIVLISRDIEVCYLMQSDKIIKVDSFSSTEKWDLFVSKAGNNVVLNPDIQSLARRLVELCVRSQYLGSDQA